MMHMKVNQRRGRFDGRLGALSRATLRVNIGHWPNKLQQKQSIQQPLRDLIYTIDSILS
jgi:hypothetical protein